MLDPADLKVLRLSNVRNVPRRLLEQVKGRNYDIDLIQLITEFPAEYFIYGFFDYKGVMQGILMFNIDLSMQAIFINILSFDKQYQYKRGRIWEIVKKLVSDVAKRFAIYRVYALTTRPKAFESYGWHDTKNRLMVYYLGEDDGGG